MRESMPCISLPLRRSAFRAQHDLILCRRGEASLGHDWAPTWTSRGPITALYASSRLLFVTRGRLALLLGDPEGGRLVSTEAHHLDTASLEAWFRVSICRGILMAHVVYSSCHGTRLVSCQVTELSRLSRDGSAPMPKRRSTTGVGH